MFMNLEYSSKWETFCPRLVICRKHTQTISIFCTTFVLQPFATLSKHTVKCSLHTVNCMLSASHLTIILVQEGELRRSNDLYVLLVLYIYVQAWTVWNCLSTYRRTSVSRFACHCCCQALYLQQEMGGAWTHLPCQSNRGQLRWRQAVTTTVIHQQAGSAGPPPALAKTHIPVMPRTPAFHSHLWTAWPPATGLLHAPGHVCPCRGYTAHLHHALIREQYSGAYLVFLWGNMTNYGLAFFQYVLLYI